MNYNGISRISWRLAYGYKKDQDETLISHPGPLSSFEYDESRLLTFFNLLEDVFQLGLEIRIFSNFNGFL